MMLITESMNILKNVSNLRLAGQMWITLSFYVVQQSSAQVWSADSTSLLHKHKHLNQDQIYFLLDGLNASFREVSEFRGSLVQPTSTGPLLLTHTVNLSPSTSSYSGPAK